FLVLVVEEIVEELLERRALGARPGLRALGTALQRLRGRDVDHSVLQAFGNIGDRFRTTREAGRSNKGRSGKKHERSCAVAPTSKFYGKKPPTAARLHQLKSPRSPSSEVELPLF